MYLYSDMKTISKIAKSEKWKKYCTLLIVYLSLFLDNVLLTVVVPIIPDYLHTKSILAVTSENAGSPIFERLSNFALPLTNTEMNLQTSVVNYLNDSKSEHLIEHQEYKLHINKEYSKNSVITDSSQSTNATNKLIVKDNISQSKNSIDVFRSGRTQNQLNASEALRERHATPKVQNELNNGQPNANIKIKLQNRTHVRMAVTPQEHAMNQKVNMKLKSFNIDKRSGQKATKNSNDATEDFDDLDLDNQLKSEKITLGVLLSMKALIQLVANPIVSAWTLKVGYCRPVFIGNVNLLIACLLFAWGGSAWALGFARAIQGLASACIGVAGLCLAADAFANDAARSKAMGVILGSVALGVLVGYPFGGVTYQLANKAAPFFIIAVFIVMNLVLQMFIMDFSVEEKDTGVLVVEGETCSSLLRQKAIAGGVVAMFLTTGAMAALEPCLPLWMMAHFKPEKWQLGTVFIPDSLGYLLATNLLGGGARTLGRQRVALAAVAVVGLAACILPMAGSVWALAGPHAALGAALGACDAAVVPALAARAPRSLPALCCLLQTASSAAYFIAPLLGGTLSAAIGFPATMRLIGAANLAYAALLWWIFKQDPLDDQFGCETLDYSEGSDASDRLTPGTIATYEAFEMHE